MSKLSLHHEVMLLALRDKEGTFQCGSYLYAVVGAMLTELILQKRIEIESGKAQLVSVLSKKPTGDEVLGELLGKIAASKRPQNVTTWVNGGVAISKLNHRIARQLCDMKILRNEERTLLWIFTRQLYPEIDAKHERQIKNRMAKLMFGQTTKHDERTTILVALAKHAGLLKPNFDKDRLARNKQRIDNVANGDMFTARATKSAIAAMQAAIMVAVVMPAVMASNN